MFRRLANSSVNLIVLVLAAVTFVGTFMALRGLAGSQRPASIMVLTAARDLNIGDIITSASLTERSIFEENDMSLYIPANQSETVLGGVVALPIFAGQPLSRRDVIAQAGEAQRLSAALGKFPDHSLFPLPLDANNVIAPDIGLFLPGDWVAVTVVMDARPQLAVTPTPSGLEALSLVPAAATPGSSDGLGTLPVSQAEAVEAGERAFPPLAKDLFPKGVLVISVHGSPQSDTDPGSSNSGPVLGGLSQQRLLILLVPNQSREQIALAMQRADQVFISLLVGGDGTAISPGFTYWDFEKLFQTDRQQMLGGTEVVSEPTPVATPGQGVPQGVRPPTRPGGQ